MTLMTRRARYTIDIWPGFVDALASVLMVFIFMLLIFVLAQFFLTDTLAGRNQALSQLSERINQLVDVLSVERRKSAELQNEVNTLSSRLDAILAQRDSLVSELAGARTELTTAMETITTDKAELKQRLKQIGALQGDIAALKRLREQLEDQVAGLTATLKQRADELTATKKQNEDFVKRLAQSQETTRTVEQELSEQKGLTTQAEARITLLNHQLAALKKQLSELSAALALSETTVADQKIEIAELGQRLNVALTNRVQELSRYRSEFFGRLREVLGQRSDIQIVGDRFLLQSELLFASGAAELGQPGKQQLRELAKTLKDIAQEIPSDLAWVLSIAGHTDRRPIRTARFPSNWELSTARALSIVRYLIEQGIPANRLSATGFAQFHPLDPANTAAAYRRNRRIEIKLTQP